MNRLKNLSEGSFLKLLFAFFTGAFLIAAVCMPDRNAMFSGLWNILSQPSKISANYFDIGGYSATFLNMGLVGLACLLLFLVFRGTPNNVSTLGFLLTLGFCSWGINILNMWPSIFGVMIYGLVKKEKQGSLVNAMLFSTGIAPLITDLLIRYPNAEVVGFNLPGLGLALAVGFVIGFFLPAGLAHSPKVHKGFDLYSAALPIGMTAFLLKGILFETMGVALPSAISDMKVTSQMTVNIFCGVVFGLCVVFALILGCKPRDYWNLMKDSGHGVCFSTKYGNATFLMNVGIFGLFILGYYNLIGAPFNGIVFGIIFCMVCTCNSGSHPLNVLPMMLGYAAASYLCGCISPAGEEFKYVLNAQAICVGLCYANGLSPISQKYGWRYGFVAAILHYLLVTSVPGMHGGYCLYNGGFTAALICILYVPQLERFFRTKQERLEHKAAKANK